MKIKLSLISALDNHHYEENYTIKERIFYEFIQKIVYSDPQCWGGENVGSLNLKILEPTRIFSWCKMWKKKKLINLYNNWQIIQKHHF